MAAAPSPQPPPAPAPGARAEDGEEERRYVISDTPGGRPRTRRESSVLSSKPFRDRVLDSMFLLGKGDRETVRLLMRGMPVPVTYGFPNTNGGWCGNFSGFVRNFHPLLSVWMVHPLCPFSGRERFVVFICSVAFNFLWTACTTYNARRVERNVSDILKCKGVCFWWFYFISKHTVTVIYAVLIRQLVICPCLYEPVIRMACGDHTHGWRQESTKDLLSRARKLRRWKVRGDRVILALLVTHLVVIVLMIIIITTENWRHLDEYSSLDEIFLNRIFGSEVVNFFIWFPKFLPLFLFLFPIHRAMWFQGGTECDYLKCKRSIFSYTRSYNYLDADFPRCVRPETSALPRNLPYLSPTTGLSNFRRGATFVLDMTSSVRDRTRRVFSPRSAPAPAPAASTENSRQGNDSDDDSVGQLPTVPENTATP